MSDSTAMLIDTHVHLYWGDAGAMLSHAVANLSGFAQAGTAFVPCLMLTETARDRVFLELAGGAGDDAGWRRAGDAVGAGLWMSHADHGRLLLIAGGQTVTAEGVEVLSLGTRTRFDDRTPIDDTIQAVLDAGALPVLPYGLGKWLGKRGGIVAKAFTKWHERGVRLGDNAGRPSAFPTPPLFGRSRQLGHAVLTGSDPLRIARGLADPGSYGVRIEAPLDDADPAGTVISQLQALPANAEVFGRRVGLMRSVTDQIALRLNKRKSK